MAFPERLRLFVGANELSYSEAQITKTSDHIINEGKIEIEANDDVTSSSVIDFKKSDGSTTIFSAKIIDLSEIDLWKLKVLTNGYELMNTKVENVYLNQSPEAIVEDIVDNRTNNLTYRLESKLFYFFFILIFLREKSGKNNKICFYRHYWLL